MEAMRSGPPPEEETDTGAIVHRRQFEKVLGYLASSGARRARAWSRAAARPRIPLSLAGCSCVRRCSTMSRPTRGSRRRRSSDRCSRRWRSRPTSEALAIANGVSLGLTASVYTSDLGVAHRFARDVEAGYVWVNDTAKHIPGTAFGGFKDSGVGREEGVEELVSYAQVKNVNVSYAGS